MGEPDGFRVALPELRIMFPGRERTPTDHYRYNAGKWMCVAGLDPYKEQDRAIFRDAVLAVIPAWQGGSMQQLRNIIRAWNPSLASIERKPHASSLSMPPKTLLPMTRRERDLMRDIISSSLQITKKRNGG